MKKSSNITLCLVGMVAASLVGCDQNRPQSMPVTNSNPNYERGLPAESYGVARNAQTTSGTRSVTTNRGGSHVFIPPPHSSTSGIAGSGSSGSTWGRSSGSSSSSSSSSGSHGSISRGGFGSSAGHVGA